MSNSKGYCAFAETDPLTVARFRFAQSIIALHHARYRDNALFQEFLTREQAYLAAYIDDVQRGLEFIRSVPQGNA